MSAERLRAADFTEALTASGTTLTQIHGIGEVVAATIIGIVDGAVRRAPPGMPGRSSSILGLSAGAS